MKPIAKTSVLEIARDLYPFNYSVSGNESSIAINQYLSWLPFTVHNFSSGRTLRGWKIPEGWKVERAQIKYGKNMIHDCLEKTRLGCAYLSPSFQGTVSKAELLSHCSTRVDLPGATVYDWSRLYRQGNTDWGLSIPWDVLESLPDEKFEIDIKTSNYSSSMKVLDFLIRGQTDHEIVVSAHNCHPYQANDDISGCAVAISAFSELLSQSNLHYSYRLIIGPELFAPMFWMDKYEDNIEKMKACILLKSVGNQASLNIQHSFRGDAVIDQIARVATRGINSDSTKSHAFRTYHGNDETVFEAPGYEIPTVTLTRFPFKEYHTNLDVPDLLSNDSLEDSLKVLMRMINIIETNVHAVSVPKGLYCLSHPDYNLYRKAPEPGLSNEGKSSQDKSWNLMMNCLPREMSSGSSAVELSNKYNLPYEFVLDYLLSWESKNLLELEHASL